jgi:D-alanyl-lipoteichoic acid acyltransferase DltB (MBOAT superfamily)
MGFDIPDNFNYPWRSTSIDEFWRRWHITLSLWLKDYLFIPLVRHRWHYFWSFTLTFLFCGLWHSKAPSFILGGLSQGIALAARRWWDHLWRAQRENRTVLYQALSRVRLVRSPLNTALCWLFTYSFLMISLGMALDDKHTYVWVVLRLLTLVGIHSQ